MPNPSTNAKAYPLQWPVGRERTKSRGASKFAKRSIPQALLALRDELHRLGAQFVVVSTNVPLKANGDPYSDPGRMPDPGVAVFFHLKDVPYCLSCDRWLTVEENLYAVSQHIDSMRRQDRYGVATVEQSFAGFKQLAASSGEHPWWDVLKIDRSCPVEVIKGAHRMLALVYHPDRPGGSTEKMAAINVALDNALQEKAR